MDRYQRGPVRGDACQNICIGIEETIVWGLMAVNSSRQSDLADENQEFSRVYAVMRHAGTGGGGDNDHLILSTLHKKHEMRPARHSGPSVLPMPRMITLIPSVQPRFSFRTAVSTGDGSKYVPTSRGKVAPVARSPAQAVYAMPESGRQIA